LNELLNLADIHVLPQRGDAEDLVFPSKLTNMLASGRPVVSTARAGTQIAAVLDGCGVVVPPEDAAALAQALCELAADAPRRRTLGAEARRVAERLWDKNTVLANAFGPYLEPAPLAAAAAVTAAHRAPARARPRHTAEGAWQPLPLRYLPPRLRETLSYRRPHSAEHAWPLVTAAPLPHEPGHARVFDLLVGDMAIRQHRTPRLLRARAVERIVALARAARWSTSALIIFHSAWCAAAPDCATFAFEAAPRTLEALWRHVADNTLAKHIAFVTAAQAPDVRLDLAQTKSRCSRSTSRSTGVARRRGSCATSNRRAPFEHVPSIRPLSTC
jgi:hypothetical protein